MTPKQTWALVIILGAGAAAGGYTLFQRWQEPELITTPAAPVEPPPPVAEEDDAPATPTPQQAAADQSDPKSAKAKTFQPVPRIDFTLPDLEGQARRLSEWDGKVILLNFWATWCPPCRKEMPGFIALQEQYGPQGFQVVGVAIDDPEEVESFADSLGVNYPMLIGEFEAVNIVQQYGNRYGQLPYSVVIDRAGMVQFIKAGELTRPELEAWVKKLL